MFTVGYEHIRSFIYLINQIEAVSSDNGIIYRQKVQLSRTKDAGTGRTDVNHAECRIAIAGCSPGIRSTVCLSCLKAYEF